MTETTIGIDISKATLDAHPGQSGEVGGDKRLKW